jgi:enoyl-CoA hydratase/carnithine racemase
MSDASDVLLTDRPAEGVALLTLNRPGDLNALNRQLHGAIDRALGELEDDPSVRAVVMTGAGDRAFSAGYDVKELAGNDADQMLLDYLAREPWMWHVATCRKPVVAAVNGYAWGGGSVIATGADVRVGCSKTSFKVTAARYGGVNASWSLPTVVGVARAKEWLLTAREVGPDELLAAGWLNHLVADDQVVPKAVELASMIAANPPPATEATKELLNASIGRSLGDSQRNETVRLVTDLRPGRVSELFQTFLAKSSSGPGGPGGTGGGSSGSNSDG